jgi:hypothetical protein
MLHKSQLIAIYKYIFVADFTTQNLKGLFKSGLRRKKGYKEEVLIRITVLVSVMVTMWICLILFT